LCPETVELTLPFDGLFVRDENGVFHPLDAAIF
jgi:hypothetical protein